MKNSLMKKYESMGFDKGQLEEIRQGVVWGWMALFSYSKKPYKIADKKKLPFGSDG